MLHSEDFRGCPLPCKWSAVILWHFPMSRVASEWDNSSGSSVHVQRVVPAGCVPGVPPRWQPGHRAGACQVQTAFHPNLNPQTSNEFPALHGPDRTSGQVSES